MRLAPEDRKPVKPAGRPRQNILAIANQFARAVGLSVEVFTEGEKDSPPCYWTATILEVKDDA